MRVHLNSLCIIVVLCVACTQKSLPVITSRTIEPIKKEKNKSFIVPDLVVGKSIFMNSCGKCHDLPQPEQFTTQRWDGILSYMIPRARLNQDEGIHITAFLKANALK